VVPKLLGRAPANKQHPWGRLECYVPQGDRYHTAQAVPAGDTQDRADPGEWKGHDVCKFSCPCTGGAAAAAAVEAAKAAAEALAKQPYPNCIAPNSVLRHAGAHAIFVDVSMYGSAGCWQNDCKHTDKFNSEDKTLCARVCMAVDECTHWTFGEQDGVTKCFFRKSDAGRESADGWHAAPKTCAPPLLPEVAIAKAASQVLLKCDGGKSDACPDMARAITTWKFAIRALQKAAEGKVDANTFQYLTQIGSDTDAFASQMSEENFPVIVGNNRQVFNALSGWVNSQPGIDVNPADLSLPNVLRGELCRPNSCYEKVV